MKILAIEFSSEQRSVAVVERPTAGEPCVFASASDCSRETSALVLIERALNESKIEREAIEVIAIGIGPGSYTGIRAAIALAQGWQLASGEKLKILGVSSAECIAFVAQKEKRFGKVRVIIDAQRNELYTACYRVDAKQALEIEPLKLQSLAVVKDVVGHEETTVGPEIHKWFAHGVRLFPEASVLGLIASTRTNFISAEEIQPIYLRETSFVKAPPRRTVS
jgi:tRNA threonylcarbamoyladenosine biosynthesis protein TsaB